LPYLLIRQNDWVVSPISADARASVEARITNDYLPHFLHCLPLAIHLLAYSRYDHSRTVRRVIEIVVQPKNDASLADAIGSPNRSVRREVVRIALELEGDHKTQVITHGLTSADAIVRLRCSRSVRQCFTGGELKVVLERLKKDHFVPVRREAFVIEAALFPMAARQVWQEGLLDPSPSIRDLARFQMAKIGEFDAAQFYRVALLQNPDSLPAFQGIGESGNESDLQLVRSHLRNSLPRWRRAAVRSLASLGKDAVVKELIECLRDDSPGVVRVVRQQLGGRLDSSTNERLFEIAAQDHRQHARDTALRLISDTGKWCSLAWLIRASGHQDLDTAALAQQLVEDSFSPPMVNRVFTKPSEVEREAIKNALAGSERAMPEPFLSNLKDWLVGI
jgi:HEAT repeat protein